MTARRGACALVVALFAAGCRETVTVRVDDPADELLLTISVEDDVPPDATPAITALDVHVDGRPAQEVLIVPGSGRRTYDALIGPLPSGEHTIHVKPSTHWAPHARVRTTGIAVRRVAPHEPDHELFRRAPALILRPDTVGTANDLPMLMYVEDRRDTTRALRYTAIFTNEDGGTDTTALFARWGRACDIEEVYQTRLDPSGRPIEETFQGPEHEIRPFNGRRIGEHPVLMVATRNNMVLDSGEGAVMIRPVPVPVVPDASPREAILDDRPWLQRLTARELAAENKPFDPRDFVYLDAKLRLVDAAASAWLEQPDGTRVTSHRGDEKLAVARDGWVRVAVPLPRGTAVAAAGWSCLPYKGKTGPCEIEPAGIFRLSDDFTIEVLRFPFTKPQGRPEGRPLQCARCKGRPSEYRTYAILEGPGFSPAQPFRFLPSQPPLRAPDRWPRGTRLPTSR